MVTANLVADPIPGWARRLLILATVWLVLLGTVVPVFAPGLGAWLPAHEHHTLTAFVPPHTHTYEHATNAPAGAACEATPHGHTSAPDATVVCTMSDDIASGSLAVVIPDAPVTLPGVPAPSASDARITLTTPVDPHASVVTPPPRP